jgi:hypothetical protein
MVTRGWWMYVRPDAALTLIAFPDYSFEHPARLGPRSSYPS